MRHRPGARFGALLVSIITLPLLNGCSLGPARPLRGIDRQLQSLGVHRAPSLAGRWLALIADRNGREQVVLIDLQSRLPVPLPGLNRPDAQPLSVSVAARGEKLALVRQREGRTELVLYRRSLGSVMRLPISPAGVPRQISLRADGREMAVEVSRGGRWQLDLIAIP